MSRTRRNIILAGIVLLAVMAVVFMAVQQKADDQPSSSSTGTGNRVNPTYFAVNITNARSYRTEIPGVTDYELGNALWKKINQDISQRQDYYFGNIRDGSIQKSTSQNGIPVVAFIIDMPDQKRSLKVTIDGGDDAEYNSTYITCPTDAELVYEKTPCTEDNG